MQDIKQLFETSQRVLITSHISPDPDAVCSTLLLSRTLSENFTGMQVRMVLEEKPGEDLGFLEGYEHLEFLPLLDAINDFQPDLFINLDGNNFKRVSRTNGEEIKTKLAELKTKLVIIDHHEEDDKDEANVFINNKRPATAEEVYNLCFDLLELQKPKNYAETTLLGIISDTQRHRFDHPGYMETYRIVSQLLDDGASIEKLEIRLEHFNHEEIEVIAELATNITDSGEGYTYSFVSDKFSQTFYNSNKSQQAIKDACDEFVNHYIRCYEGNRWGFVVYPERIGGKITYGVTLRSVAGTKDVSSVARHLGGGGHKPAAGAKINADSIESALVAVKAVV